jgi:Flp pilus assembly protein TadD
LRSPARFQGLLGLLLIPAGVAVYSNGLAGPFIFDDLRSIVENPHVRSLRPLSRALSAPDETTAAGRPVVCLSLAINHAIGGLDPRGYHAFNVAVHVLAALALFGIVRRTLLAPWMGDRFGRSAGRLALAAALLWMLHPLQTESVCYVIQRTELLMGLFYLLTLYGAIRGWSSAGGCGRIAWFAAAAVACAAGMASKESMVSAPLIVLAYDAMFVSGSLRQGLRRHAGLYAGLAAAWVLLAVLMASGPRSESVGFAHGITAWGYLRTQAGVIVHYLRLAVWPHPLVLSYDDWPIARSFTDTWAQAVVVLALLAGTFLALYRRSWLGLLGLAFFCILAPTSSFVPIATEVAAERRMYLPLAAIVVLLVIGGHHLVLRAAGRFQRDATWPRAVGAALVIAVAGVLAYLTIERNRDYRDELTIWADTVAKRPGNAAARVNYGNVLFARGEQDAAIGQYTEAIRIKPDHAETHYNLANALADRGRPDAAITHYDEALRLRSGYAEAYGNKGILLARLGRMQEALACYERALAIAPGYLAARNNLGLALAGQKRWEEAIAHFERAVALAPEAVMFRMNLAGTLLDKGDFTRAAEAYRRVLERAPGHADAHCNLGITLAMQKDYPAAVHHLREALRLQPGHPGAAQVLRGVLAEQAQGSGQPAQGQPP